MIIDKKSTYEFDTIWEKIPVFTDKNIALITAMVNNDSAYRRAFDITCGTSSAGFLSKGFPESYKDILEAVKLLDRENSTHLSSTGRDKGSGGGRDKVAEYVKAHHDAIQSEIASGNASVVIELSEKPIPGRLIISFASKFCAFTNRYCFGGDCYSIVDNFLLQVLPAYEAIYLNVPIDKRKWLRQQENKYFDYKAYQDTIQEILNKINGSGDVSTQVGRKEFDLLLWYYYKGSEDRIKHLYQIVSEHI